MSEKQITCKRCGWVQDNSGSRSMVLASIPESGTSEDVEECGVICSACLTDANRRQIEIFNLYHNVQTGQSLTAGEVHVEIEGGLHWVVRYNAEAYTLPFKVYEVGVDGTEDSPFGEGFLKWDGCLNISLGDSCMMHFCEAENATIIQKTIEAIYALGPKIQAWDR